MKLSVKVALTTGASRGIGKSVAEAFAQEGARLFLVGHTDGEALGQTLAGIGQSGTEAEGGLFDVGSYADVKTHCRCHRSALRHARHSDQQRGKYLAHAAVGDHSGPMGENGKDASPQYLLLHGEMVRRFLKPKRSGKIVKIHRALRGQRLLWLGRLRVGKGGHHRVYQERGARTASTQHSGQCRAACGTQPNDWRWPNIMAASSAPKRRHA